MKNVFLIIVLAVIAGSIIYLESFKPKVSRDTASQSLVPAGSSEKKLEVPATENKAKVETSNASERISKKSKRYEPGKEIVNPSGFINRDPFRLKDFIGKKVILVDFWTYSCINCQRTLPYLNAWYEKYKDQGLEIVSIHTPEFEFEKQYNNVQAAVKKYGVQYPVVLDNDRATWGAYQNQYWPHKYLIDIDGFIVYDHIGEGSYDETEKKIQELLEERMVALHEQGNIAKDTVQPAHAPAVNFSEVKSPEIYFGSFRNQKYLGNGRGAEMGIQHFIIPQTMKENALYLEGDWNITPEFAESKSAGARILFRYNAKSVYIVASSVESAPVKILRDGKPLAGEAGEDIDKKSSTAVIQQDRLYKLIEDSDYSNHALEIIIEKPGLRAFTFTFG